MLGASLIYQTAKATSLARLAATPHATWLTRGAGAKLRAALIGTSLEVAAFTLLHHGLMDLSGEQVPWDGKYVWQDLSRNAITLGALKFSAGLGNRIAGTSHILAPTTFFLGLLGSHHLQVALQLQPRSNDATLLTDTLANFIALGIGAQLGRRVLGNHPARLHRDLETRIQSIYAQVPTWAFSTPSPTSVPSGAGIRLTANETFAFMAVKKGLPAGTKKIMGPLRVHGIARFLEAVEKKERGEKAPAVDLYGLGKDDVLAYLREKNLKLDSAMTQFILQALFLHGNHRVSEWSIQTLLQSEEGIGVLRQLTHADPDKFLNVIDVVRGMNPDSQSLLEEFHLSGTLAGSPMTLYSGLMATPGHASWKVERVSGDDLILVRTGAGEPEWQVFKIKGAKFSRKWIGYEFCLLSEVRGGHDGKRSETERKINPAAELVQKSGGVAIQAESGERFWLKKFTARLATYLPGEWSRHRIFSIREEVKANRQLAFRVKSAGPSPIRGQPGQHIYEFELSPREALALGLFTLEEGELRRVSGGPEIFVIPEHLSATLQDMIPDASLSESHMPPPGSSYTFPGLKFYLEPHEPLEVFLLGIRRFWLFYLQDGLVLLNSIRVRFATIHTDLMVVNPVEPKHQALFGNEIALHFVDPHPFSEGEYAMLVLPVNSGLKD